MQPFYDVENLNTYPSVNPAREKGQQLMDAGRVYFADGAPTASAPPKGKIEDDGRDAEARNKHFWAKGVGPKAV